MTRNLQCDRIYWVINMFKKIIVILCALMLTACSSTTQKEDSRVIVSDTDNPLYNLYLDNTLYDLSSNYSLTQTGANQPFLTNLSTMAMSDLEGNIMVNSIQVGDTIGKIYSTYNLEVNYAYIYTDDSNQENNYYNYDGNFIDLSSLDHCMITIAYYEENDQWYALNFEEDSLHNHDHFIEVIFSIQGHYGNYNVEENQIYSISIFHSGESL